MNFEIDEKDYRVITVWMKEHKCSVPKTTIGGRFTFKFTPTGVGTYLIVECVCGECFDIDTMGD